MYVRPTTTQEEIANEILRIERELKRSDLSDTDRQALHDELDYLWSFLTR